MTARSSSLQRMALLVGCKFLQQSENLVGDCFGFFGSVALSRFNALDVCALILEQGKARMCIYGRFVVELLPSNSTTRTWPRCKMTKSGSSSAA